MSEEIVVKILIVDDDYVTRLIHKKIIAAMTEFCAIVTEATNGIEALEILGQGLSDKNKAPDLILLDTDMPHMGGFQFLEEFNKTTFLSPCEVIIVTNSDTLSDQLRATSLGVKYFYTKPLKIEKLRAAILEVLAK